MLLQDQQKMIQEHILLGKMVIHEQTQPAKVFSAKIGLRTGRMHAVPHSVQDGAVLHDSEESVGCRHVVSHRSFAVPEERVRGPDFGHHQVI